VLKITRLARHGRVQTIKLEGAILSPWVGAVRDACTTPDRQSAELRLDLAAVHYADAAGVRLLGELMREGVEIATCSGFIGELLHLGDSVKPAAAGAPVSCPPPSASPNRP
jgi:ABC-type transporter Mla MlaB component